MKKIIISILFIFTISGCWNYKELNDYAIATKMAIDYIDNKYILSFLITKGNKFENKSSNSKYQSILYSGEGDTIYEAMKNIDLISTKQLYIGQINNIVISEEVAKRGLYDSLNFLLNDSQSKKNFYVFIAKDNMAKDIINIDTSAQYSNMLHFKTFNDIIYDLVNDGIDTTINSYTIINDLESVQSTDYIKLDSLGIFKGDKLVGWANDNQSYGINILNNNITDMYLNVPCDTGYAVFNISKLNTKREIYKNTINISTSGIASINEITCDIDLEDNINNLEKKVNLETKRLINDGFMYARDMGSDVFGFGLDYYRNYPSEFKSMDWYDIYSKMGIKIDVDINIKRDDTLKHRMEMINSE